MGKMIFVGQAPSCETDERPAFTGRCGRFLAEMLGLPQEEMLRRFLFINLLPRFPGKAKGGDAFPMDQARVYAEALASFFSRKNSVVLLGRNVAKAFNLGSLDLLSWHHPVQTHGARTAMVPHPSGINRWYNDEANREKATWFLRSIEKGR